MAKKFEKPLILIITLKEDEIISCSGGGIVCLNTGLDMGGNYAEKI